MRRLGYVSVSSGSARHRGLSFRGLHRKHRMTLCRLADWPLRSNVSPQTRHLRVSLPSTRSVPGTYSTISNLSPCHSTNLATVARDRTPILAHRIEQYV